MSKKLCRKEVAERKRLEYAAFSAGLEALGLSPEDQKSVYSEYQWMCGVYGLMKEVNTPRIERACRVANERYLSSITSAIRNLPKPLKLADWTRAGIAMERILGQERTRN